MSEPKPKATDPKATSAKGPRAKVESAPKADQHAASEQPGTDAPDATETDAREQGAAARRAVSSATKSATSWLEGVFPGHGNAALFAIIGLVVALLFFSLGFWQTVLLVILVVAGVAFGQKLDGDPKIINALKGFFGSKR
jgi:uncharacterized membrane protein